MALRQLMLSKKIGEAREKIAAADHNQAWMTKAPVHIVCVADIRTRIQGEIALPLEEDSPMEDLKQIIRDTAIAAEHIILEVQIRILEKEPEFF